MKKFIVIFTILCIYLFTCCTNNELKGIVTEEGTKKPINGVVITVEGINIIAMTDSTGQYKIKDFPEEAKKIRFEKEGYETQSLIIKADENFDEVKQTELILDRPSEKVIQDFISNKYPKSVNVMGLGTVTHKNISVKIKNQWLDKNMKGVFYIEVERETHAFLGPHYSKYGDEGKKLGAERCVDYYVFLKKGNVWEPKKERLKTEKIWRQGNML